MKEWLGWMINGDHVHHVLSSQRYNSLCSFVMLMLSSARAKWIVSVIFAINFIYQGMADCTSLKWSDHDLSHFIFCGMVDYTSLIWNVSTRKLNISHYKALVWKLFVSLSCLFVHEPLYQTIVVCFSSVFSMVLCTQTKVLFSMLEWSSLRLTAIRIQLHTCT